MFVLSSDRGTVYRLHAWWGLQCVFRSVGCVKSYLAAVHSAMPQYPFSGLRDSDQATSSCTALSNLGSTQCQNAWLAESVALHAVHIPLRILAYLIPLYPFLQADPGLQARLERHQMCKLMHSICIMAQHAPYLIDPVCNICPCMVSRHLTKFACELVNGLNLHPCRSRLQAVCHLTNVTQLQMTVQSHGKSLAIHLCIYCQLKCTP